MYSSGLNPSTSPASLVAYLDVSNRVIGPMPFSPARSEEHTSELQSQSNLVCRLLLEKKKHSVEHSRDDLTPLTATTTKDLRLLVPAASSHDQHACQISRLPVIAAYSRSCVFAHTPHP